MSDLASITKDLNTPVEKRGAIVDSGATSHFCPDRACFSNFIEIQPQKIHTADSLTLSAIGQGDIQIDLTLGQGRTSITLKNTLYTPKMAFTLISTNCIMAVGLVVHFEGWMCRIFSLAPKHQLIAEIPR